MKKIFLYSLAVLASVILASCNGDYDDWAQPQHNPQEEAITIPGFTATPVVQSIDCSNVTTDSVSIFTLSEAALPEGFTLDNARLEIIPQGEDNAIKKNVNASIEGKSAVAELSEVIVSFYGKRPIAHPFVAHVYLNAIKNGDAVLIDAGKFNLEMTPKSPFIDSGYYLVGDMFNAEGVDGWNTVSAKQAFMHSDKDVYDDPKFTITFETKKADQYWKIIPKKNIDAVFCALKLRLKFKEVLVCLQVGIVLSNSEQLAKCSCHVALSLLILCKLLWGTVRRVYLHLGSL